MSSFETAFKIVTELSEVFKSNESKYKDKNYYEAEVRKDFIDKFFIALGWDVNHDIQRNPYEQEVKVEKGMNIGNAQKRADYAFYLEPNYNEVKFFVEAKKPFRSILNQDDYFQTIRYGWNANTPIVVLTDFEEFHIIDSRFKPDIKNSLNRNIEIFHYTEYANEEKFRRIYHLFSRESVKDDSLNKRAEELVIPIGKGFQKGLFKGGYQSIDESFLEELDDIRIVLAKSFKKNNPGLNSEELTEVTQRTIDRLVFIRFLEDKLIEPDHYVSEFGDNNSPWNDFINVSKMLDAKYNGVVFKKHPILNSDEFKGPDQNDFGNICNELSHTNSPYDFNYIPIHILGSIYERFLGRVIHATPKQVKLEKKPEVKKAGGVFYTPQYIVKYIVDNTVRRQIENKTPEEISKLKFADISCGSGSFLITVFDILLQYIGKWYNENPSHAKKDGAINNDGEWILSLKQKRKILIDNIFGVDIDYQAVEVTQLSLFLKLLEDETTATADEMRVLFKEKILPDLSNNIICGNSLVESNIFEDNKFSLDEERKVNAMNFEDKFQKIMENGGFDSIVGNPPYIRIHKLDKSLIKYYLYNYKVATGQVDTYSLFIEKSIGKLKQNGNLGYIIPRFIKFNLDSEQVRKFLLKYHIKNLTEVGMPFKDAKTECIVLIVEKKYSIDMATEICDFYPLQTESKHLKNLNQEFFNKLPSSIFNTILELNQFEVIIKMILSSVPLSEVCETKRGMEISKKKVRANISGKKTLLGEEVNKYLIEYNNTYVLENDKEVKRLKEISEIDKILIRRVANMLIATYDDQKYYFIKNLYGLISKKVNLYFVLGLLNSKLLNFFFKKYYTSKKEDIFPEIQSYQINNLPLIIIDPNNIDKVNYSNKLISLVEQMLFSKIKLSMCKTENDESFWKDKCNLLYKQIDHVVYQLYELTEEEIRIVEGI